MGFLIICILVIVSILWVISPPVAVIFGITLVASVYVDWKDL